MLKDRRRVVQVGNSVAVTIPSSLEKGKEATLAANRIMVVDPMGEIPEDDLFQFLRDVIEPALYEPGGLLARKKPRSGD